MNYKTFDYPYSKDSLLSIFNKLKSDGKSQVVSSYQAVDLTDISQNMFPRMDVFDRTLDIKEYVLAELIQETGYQINPGNNGLILFPVSGLLNFTFEDGSSIDVTTPIITNGKVSHNIIPKEGPAIFFAIKIPADVSWLS